MRIAIGSDHAGLTLRQQVVEHLKNNGHAVTDVGTATEQSVDYPVYAKAVSDRVAKGDADLGILICGTGMGMSMAANRVPGVRAALCTNEFLAKMARAHNDANVLCLGQRVLGVGLALSVVDAFVNEPFEGGRHARRVQQLTEMERSQP